MNFTPLSVTILALALAACSDSGPTSGSSAGSPGAAAGKTESVFKTQTDALEKAKEVETITQDAAEKEKQQVEEQTN